MSFIVRNFLDQLSLWQKKNKNKRKKNKKQLVLKAEKKYEDRGENVTLNVICQIFFIIIIIIIFVSFSFYRHYPTSLNFSNKAKLPWNWIITHVGPYLRERKFGGLVVTTSIKRRSTTFHVVVVPWRQRNIPTSLTHVNFCLFKPLFLWRSRCYPCYGNSNEPIRFQTKSHSGQPAWRAMKWLGVNNDFYYISWIQEWAR